MASFFLCNFSNRGLSARCFIVDIYQYFGIERKVNVNPRAKLYETKLLSLLYFLIFIHVPANSSCHSSRNLSEKNLRAICVFYDHCGAFVFRA